jgi:glutamine cyclotransferase
MTKQKTLVLGLLILGEWLFLLGASKPRVDNFEKKAPVFEIKIVRVFPHDRQAFTQGLVFHQGFLYEGTGLYGQSGLRQVNLETGKVIKNHRLPGHLFGEGITIWKDQLIQLTWQNRIGLVYQRDSFKVLKTFTYPGEGWGLTHNGKELIISDGSDTLRFWDPSSYKEVRRIKVQDQGRPVVNLNELEYIQGEIWANVFLTDRIVRISPESGRVTGWIDLTGLLSREEQSPQTDVLNGIAYDAQKNRIFVTGKYWPKLFEIKINEKK